MQEQLGSSLEIGRCGAQHSFFDCSVVSSGTLPRSVKQLDKLPLFFEDEIPNDTTMDRVRLPRTTRNELRPPIAFEFKTSLAQSGFQMDAPGMTMILKAAQTLDPADLGRAILRKPQTCWKRTLKVAMITSATQGAHSE